MDNAGIQRRLTLTEPEPWSATRHELAINVERPCTSQCLCFHICRHARARPTKAALRSFTLSLRTP